MFDPKQPKRALAIVENAAHLNPIREYLTRAGFEIRVATSSNDVIRQLNINHIDVIINEIQEVPFEGDTLQEKLQANPNARNIPCFYIVPEDNQDIFVQALRNGADDIITTPFDPVELVARVEAVLTRKRMYLEMTNTDPLTRLLNRSNMHEKMQLELARAIRYERKTALVAIDVDNLGNLNQLSGSVTGDLLLTCLSGVILKSIRNIDIAGRYQGDEFLICLPETDGSGAKCFLDRVNRELTAIAKTIADIDLTFCSSIVIAPDHGENFDILYKHAHQAIQEAKKQGSDLVAVWTPEKIHISSLNEPLTTAG